MYNILGVQVSKGNYNGYDFNNVKFHCSYNSSNEHVVGQQVETISVTKDYYDKEIKLPHAELVGKSVNIFFDKKGKVILFEIKK